MGTEKWKYRIWSNIGKLPYYVFCTLTYLHSMEVVRGGCHAKYGTLLLTPSGGRGLFVMIPDQFITSTRRHVNGRPSGRRYCYSAGFRPPFPLSGANGRIDWQGQAIGEL